MYFNKYSIILYIQIQLAEGKEPSQNGIYSFTRKEIIEWIGCSPSFFDRHKSFAVDFLANNFKMIASANFTKNRNENLYNNVCYEKGKLLFQKNPIYNLDEYQYLWAMHPGENYFTYDSFDEQHRRRYNGDKIRYGMLPWSWDEDRIECELTKMK